MRGNRRELSEKYKSQRLQPNPLFLSRFLETFFNKFIKKGKKALARNIVHEALINLRMNVRRPTLYNVLMRMFQTLRMQFLLVNYRKGRKILPVPVPVRRNKRDVLNLQMVAKAAWKREDRKFVDSLSSELITLVTSNNTAATVRQLSDHNEDVFENRVHLDYRWK